jgi:hypothetical protein
MRECLFGVQMHTRAWVCLHDRCLQSVHAWVPTRCSTIALMLVRMFGDAKMHTRACICLCDSWLAIHACVVLKHCFNSCAHVCRHSKAYACLRHEWWLTRACVCACLVFCCTRVLLRACAISGLQRVHAQVPARCSNIAYMRVCMFGDAKMHMHACGG